MSQDSPDVRVQLRELGDSIRDAYAENRRVMSFAEYVELAAETPTRQLRSAPQYLKSCFDHWGSREVAMPAGKVRHFNLFDCPWADGRDQLVGQEEVQERIYRAICNFVNEGTANKLVLLHGPNGSAKSTLIRCIGRALQSYSTLDEGAVYRINWVFPGQKVSRSGIGFSGGKYEEVAVGDTFAYLPEELVDAKMGDEVRDHPLFLIPPRKRCELMLKWLEEHGASDFVLSDYLLHGRLTHKNRAVYEALLASYQGDYAKLLRHVQIERYYIQHRYREGYVTVEPQLSVDAGERQITADRSMAALPTALQNLTLFEYGGELVNANRGLIEFSDLLKRPLEAYKYLLTTVEQARVSLPNATLFLDLVFLGTTNEIHLAAFKEIPEFQSFRGRLELVRVPYLLDYRREAAIYAAKLKEAASSRHVAPHCAYVAALWAVLTRMRKPMADKFSKELGELVSKLSPLEKAELYADAVAPDQLPAAKARELTSHIGELWRESESYPNYEGRMGASPREIQTAIFNAANSTRYTYVSPLAILDEIEELTKQTSVYQFLKQEALPGGYHDHPKFVEDVRERLADVIDEDLRQSLGLVEDVEYQRLFDRYVTHVKHWTNKEKVRNPTTGKYEDPDESMMVEVEKTLGVGDDKEFRQDVIAKIGAWSLDHPDRRPEYDHIFADHFKRLRESYFEERKKQVKAGVEDLLKVLTDNAQALSAQQRRRAEAVLERFQSEHGYNLESARDAVVFLVKRRYSQ